MPPPSTASVPAPFFIADHPVLDFLNTVAVLNGGSHDFLGSDSDVCAWLEQAGIQPGAAPPKLPPGVLLKSARHLREMVRVLIEKKKSGARLDLKPFNALLAQSKSWLQLDPDASGGLTLQRYGEAGTAAQYLSSLSESAAELLASGDFELIRKCEDPTCVLWFYDRTKSHRRRWCSMAACGNRNKVKAFRQRQGA
jgi:predicted RNA-binding Zn ribbon-like protein